MLAAAAIARRGEKRGSRPRSERKAPPGEPRAGSKTREPTTAPVRWSPDHTSGHYSDIGIGSSESSSNGGPFAPTGGTGSGAGSRGYLHGSVTPKVGDRAFPVHLHKGNVGAAAGQLGHLGGGVTDRGMGGVAKTASLGMSDRAHGSSSAYADTSRLLHAPDRVGSGASGGVGRADRAGSDSGGDSGNRDPRVIPIHVDAYVVVRSESQVCKDMVHSYAITMDRLNAKRMKNVAVAEWVPEKEAAYTSQTMIVFCVNEDHDIMTVHRKLVYLGTEGLNRLNIKMIQYLYTSQNAKAQYMIPPGLFDETHGEKVVEGHTTLGDIYISTQAPRTGPDYKVNLVSDDNICIYIRAHIRAHMALQTFKSHLDNSSEGKGKNMRLVVDQYDIHNKLNKPIDSGALVIVITMKRLIEKGGGYKTYNDEVNLVREWADSVTGGVMLVDSTTNGSERVSVEIDRKTVQIQLNTLLPVSAVIDENKGARGVAGGSYTDQSALLDRAAVMPILELNSSEMRVSNDSESLDRREIKARAILHDARGDAELMSAVAKLANGHYKKYKKALDSLVKSNADKGLIPYLISELNANRAASHDGDRAYALSGNPETMAREKFKELEMEALRKQKEAAESIVKSVLYDLIDSATKPEQGRSRAKKEVSQDTQVTLGQWLQDLKDGVRKLINTELRARRIDADRAESIRSLVDEIGDADRAESIRSLVDEIGGALAHTDRKMSPHGDAAGHIKRLYDKLKWEVDSKIHEASENQIEELRAQTQRVELLEAEAKRQMEATGITGVITEQAVQEAENTVFESAKALVSSGTNWFGNIVRILKNKGQRLVSENGAAGLQSLLSRASLATPRVVVEIEMVSKAAEDPNVKSVVEGLVSMKHKTRTDLLELAKSAENIAAQLGPLAAHALVEGVHSAINERAGHVAAVANPPNLPPISLEALGELAIEVSAFDVLNQRPDTQPAVASRDTQEAVSVLIRDADSKENIPKLIKCLTLARALGATGTGGSSVLPVIVLISLFEQQIRRLHRHGIPPRSREPIGIRSLNITRGSLEPMGAMARPRNQLGLQPNAAGQGLESLVGLLIHVLTHGGEVIVSSNPVGFCGTEAEDNKSEILKALGVLNARVVYVKGDSSKPLPALGTDMLFDHIVIGRTCAYNNTADTAATCFMAYLYHVTESISVVARNNEEAEWIKWVVCSTLFIRPELIESRPLQSGTLLTMRRVQVMSAHRVPESGWVLRKALGIVVTRPRAALMIGDATLSDATRAAVDELVKEVYATANTSLIEAVALTETAPTQKPRGDEGDDVPADKCGDLFKEEIKRLMDERNQNERYKLRALLVSAIASQVDYDDICNTIAKRDGERNKRLNRGYVYKLASTHLFICEKRADRFMNELRKNLEKQNLEIKKGDYKRRKGVRNVEVERVLHKAVETVVSEMERIEAKPKPNERDDAKQEQPESKSTLGRIVSFFYRTRGSKFGSDPKTAMQRFV